jgi:hypothetical protein
MPERLNSAQIERSERAYRKSSLNLSNLSQHTTIEIYVNLETMSDHQLHKWTNMRQLRFVDQVLVGLDSHNQREN